MVLTPKKKKVVLAGSVTTRSGYGARARDLAHALISSGKYDLEFVPLRWGNTPQDALNPNDPKDAQILSRMSSGQLPYQPDVFIHLTIPNEFQKVGKYNIGVTAGIETTMCKPEWIDGCNRMDLVLTSSEHSKRVFETVKYEKRDSNTNAVIEMLTARRPIKTLFEGIDLNVYNKSADRHSVIYKDISSIKESFCFLFVGHWLQGDMGADRKDIGMMLNVFMETFKQKSSKNRPALVLKTSMAGFSEPERSIIIKRIQDIRGMIKTMGWKKDLPNIYLLHGSLTDAEMNTLYNHPKIKAMVSFTHGEGFGRPLLEFTTTGKPVIAPNWSGQVDFLNPHYSILLPGELEPVHPSAVNDWIVQDSKWFRVDYKVGSNMLNMVFDKYDNVLETSRKHRKYTSDNFSMDKMAAMLCDYIDNIDTYANTTVSSEPQHVKLNLPKLELIKPSDKLTLPK